MVTRRARIRDATKEEIKAIARRQMAEQGTAAISLRGIAREMEVTPTALYRYFASHDDLITELILDAYHAHADALEAADRKMATEDYKGRMYAVLMVFRGWAIEHPTDFQLIYGNPIPGYHAPDEPTIEAVRRNMSVVVNILNGAMKAGKLKPEHTEIPQAVAQQITRVNSYDVPDTLVYIGMTGWTRIHGIIMLELFNHIQNVVGDTEAFYQHQVQSLIQHIGLTD
jgi:AcrR family transcriptional regulator